MSVSVVVPFRPGDPERDRLWAWCRARWEMAFPGWEIVVAADDDCLGPWRKGVAIRHGLLRASGEIVAIVDADVWCDQVAAAVELVRSGTARWVAPFRRVLRLTPGATERVLGGEAIAEVGARGSAWVEPAYVQSAAGGMVAMPRETAVVVPMDPRFAGWGGEDHAWAYALETLVGPRVRLDGPLWHLWHAPAPRLSRAVGSVASERLRRCYAAARERPDAMRRLVAEARAAAVEG